MSRLLLPLLLMQPLLAFAVDYEQELAGTRERILRHEENLHLATTLQDKMQNTLTDFSNGGIREIGSLRQQLQQIQQQAAELATRLQGISTEINADLPKASTAIKRIHQFAHASVWSQLFTKNNPQKLQRMSVVDEYLRHTSNTVLQQHISKVAAHRQLQQQHQQATTLLQQQEQQLASILQQHIKQKSITASKDERLQKSIQQNQAALDKLYHTELYLLARIHGKYDDPEEQYAATELLRPVFATQKGKLSWPVQGKVRRSDSRADWGGVFIDHNAGQPVQAVSDGRVVFADAFKPIGNMVILDHGDGFMSLYAHDASISPSPGDWLAKGDIIASVGDNAGDSDSILYFEIRHHGNPVNPIKWCN